MEIQKDLPMHYRYEDCAHEDGLTIEVRKFYPVGETRCFYLVINEWQKHSLSIGHNKKPKVRRVSKNASRSYCHSSMDKALYSYKKRKQSQIGHNEFALAKAKAALNRLEGVKSGLDSFDAGRPDYWDQLNFD